MFVDDGAAFTPSWRPPDHQIECGCNKIVQRTPESWSLGLKRAPDVAAPAPAKRSKSTALSKSWSGALDPLFVICVSCAYDAECGHTESQSGESKTSKTPQAKKAEEIPRHLSEVRTILQYEKGGSLRQV